MEFKAKPRTEVKIDVDGVVTTIYKPSFGQIEDFEAKFHGAQEGGSGAACLREFLVDLGLENDTVRRFEIEDVEHLIEVLTGKKKS